MNSFHHQAVDRLGSGLRAVAWAPDGVIEAIESSGAALYLGVQWHVETLIDRPAARARCSTRSSPRAARARGEQRAA